MISVRQKSIRVFEVEYPIVKPESIKDCEWNEVEEWLDESGYGYEHYTVSGTLNTFIQEVFFSSSNAAAMFKLTWM